jgi:hypothetical protein
LCRVIYITVCTSATSCVVTNSTLDIVGVACLAMVVCRILIKPW